MIRYPSKDEIKKIVICVFQNRKNILGKIVRNVKNYKILS